MRVALLTARDALALDDDMPPLIAACQARGLSVETPCWDDPAIEWQTYDAAVLRSTWDYATRHDAFLATLTRIAEATALFNPLDAVRFSLDKHYLGVLADAGVATVPTRFVEPGAEASRALQSFITAAHTGTTPDAGLGAARDFVIKPAVGAGSKDAARYRRSDEGDAARARAHLARLLAEGRSALLQPYLARVDDAGETALVYLDGRLSHAIRKGPLLRAGADLVDGLFAVEAIAAREPTKAEGRVGKAAFNAIPCPTPLYARVDLVRDDDGEPRVLELELVEPSLFFAHADGSAARFADALIARLRC